LMASGCIPMAINSSKASCSGQALTPTNGRPARRPRPKWMRQRNGTVLKLPRTSPPPKPPSASEICVPGQPRKPARICKARAHRNRGWSSERARGLIPFDTGL
jgi:hypothetical protein